MEAEQILAIIGASAAAISSLIGLAGVVAEKTKNETDNKIVQWVRLIWSFIPIGNMNPGDMGKKE